MSGIEQARQRDRRVARTKATLQSAFLSLLLSKPYDRITIKQICATANVGRSTFYAHFRSKDDLKRSGLEHLRQMLAERQAQALTHELGARGALSFSRAMFEHGREYSHHYRALRGSRGGAVAIKKIRQVLLALMRDEPLLRAQEDPTTREVGAQFLVGAFMAVLIWWLDRGATLPPEQIDATFGRLTADGFGARLDEPKTPRS